MPEKEVFELLGLPHRSTVYIDSSSYDYVSENGILRVEFEYFKLKHATFFGMEEATTVPLKEKKTNVINRDKYLREIDTHITSDELEFINRNVNAEKIQSTIGPPHSYIEYNVDGFELNAFVYNLNAGNKLLLVYKQNGTVGMAQIQDKDGEILKSIVEFEE